MGLKPNLAESERRPPLPVVFGDLDPHLGHLPCCLGLRSINSVECDESDDAKPPREMLVVVRRSTLMLISHQQWISAPPPVTQSLVHPDKGKGEYPMVRGIKVREEYRSSVLS
jgi:hypothetical protein